MASDSVFYSGDEFIKDGFPPKGTKETQFSNCTFTNIDFSVQDIRHCDFAECHFINCNFAMVNFALVGLNDVLFKECKLLGADFSKAKDFLFGVDFEDCLMDYVVFGNKKNRKHRFANCALKSADFQDGDFAECIFDRCDLRGAVFVNVNLRGADFSTSEGLILDPEQNYLAKATFSLVHLPGLLVKYNIRVAQH